MKKILIISVASMLLLSSATYASTQEKASINKQDTQALFGTNKVKATTLNNSELVQTEGKIMVTGWFLSTRGWVYISIPRGWYSF